MLQLKRPAQVKSIKLSGVSILLAGVVFIVAITASISAFTSTSTGLMTVVSLLSSSANDAEENLNSNNVDLTSPDLQLGEANNTDQLVGLRFTNITIPRNAIILNAYVEFEVDETGSLPTSLTIQGQAVDNPSAFSSTKNNLSNRARTTAQVNWNNLPAWDTLNAKRQTPNLAAILQELVKRPNWVSGNAVVLLISGMGQRTAKSYDGESAAAAKLVISYALPTPTPTSVPVNTPTALPFGAIRFAVIGDYGDASQPELDVANLVKSWDPEFIITTGDNNYPDGAANTIDANIGQYYHEFIHPYLGSYGSGADINRFFPSLGNHDWHTPNARPYLDYFTLPGNERYYDFVWGPVHFYSIDSDGLESDGTSSTSTQGMWLQNSLATSTSAWDLVYMHHPPYSSSSNHGSTTRMQWPYAAWGAEAVLAGHDHTYERIVRDGITYFVNGLGGRSIYSFGSPIAGSRVRYNGDYGAMLVEANEWKITFWFINRAGSTIDTYTLNKPSTPINTCDIGTHENKAVIARFPAADFNGDGQTDVAVFRPSNGTWYIQDVGSFVCGSAGDIPVPADYDGDGKDEIAVFRPSNSTWYIYGVGSFVHGTVGDSPVVADYNGDGKADIAVFRPSNSTWYILGVGPRVYGTVGDIPVVADYDGDGKDDIAVFRPSNSTWYLYGIGPRVYGTVGDIPVVADYNGDGKDDIAVFRPSNSTWYLYGIGPFVYGTVGDIPVIGDYNGDGKADIAVFRPANSTWYLYGMGPRVYGTVGDIPV